MTLTTLIEEIKTEARIKTDDEFNPLVISLINESLYEAAMQQMTPELADAVTLPLTTGGVGLATLPDDYLRINQLSFFTTDGSSWRLHDKEGIVPPAPIGFYGYPKSYVIRNSTILAEPEAEIESGDSMELEYYKRPIVYLDKDGAKEVEPDRLVPFVKKFAIARIHLFHAKTELAGAYMPLVQGAAQGSVIDNAPTTDPK